MSLASPDMQNFVGPLALSHAYQKLVEGETCPSVEAQQHWSCNLKQDWFIQLYAMLEYSQL